MFHLFRAAPRAVWVGVLLIGLGATVPGDDQDDAVARVEVGLQEADPDAVLADAASRVQVVLFGQGGMYRRAQATHVLRDFFRRYPPLRVDFSSERAASVEGLAASGRYWSETGGGPLSVRVLHREDGDDWELVSIRVEQRSAVRADGR